MTARLTDAELAEIEALEARASKMVHDLCRSRADAQHREWLMSIPARPDYDPDLVIGAALCRIPHLIAHIRALKESGHAK